MTRPLDIIDAPSPNFGPRRDGLRPEFVVLHYTAMTTAEAALEQLCDSEAEVSAHYLIAEDGRLWQLVPDEMRAWHAGQGRWQGKDDLNSRSIGIELANTGLHPFPEPQMDVLERLLATILGRWAIPPQNVLAHSDFAPSRKSDPGRRFDWQRLARQDLSVWPDDPVSAPEVDIAGALAQIGYPVAEEGLTACLSAFRDRFRPGATGEADSVDLSLASNLAERFGVDRTASNA